MLSEKVIHMLKTQPDLIWEAIGIDGMTYDFDDSRYDKSKEQKARIQERVNFRDEDQITTIGSLIVRSQAVDTLVSDAMTLDEILGSIVRKQITDFLKRVEELGNE